MESPTVYPSPSPNHPHGHVPIQAAAWAGGSPEPRMPTTASSSIGNGTTSSNNSSNNSNNNNGQSNNAAIAPATLPSPTATATAATATATTTQSLTSSSSQPNLTSVGSKSCLKSLAAPTKKHAVKISEKAGETVNARRQKRLERNRESARLSRRRRKNYLEELENQVTQLSLEMDQSRRAHASHCIPTVAQKRQEFLQQAHTMEPNQALSILDTALARNSQQISVVSTFQLQQLKSFALPVHSKFVLWLTLQGDVYFRGGRAASERLSAARIGERMLQSGNDRVTPINSMWPLFCHEVALSYEQEERVRTFQRTLLQDPNSWLQRHAARSTTLVMDSFHDSLNGVGLAIRQRKQSMANPLTPAQRLKFLAWAQANKDRIRQTLASKHQAMAEQSKSDPLPLSPHQHVASNLYILNSRLQQVLSRFPHRIDLVSPVHLKRFRRRPSFESLGQQKDEMGSGLSRESSFASTGSLRRTVSSLSVVSENGEEKAPQQLVPEECEAAVAPVIERELGFVRSLIPPIVQPMLPSVPAPVPLPPAHQTYAPPPVQQQQQQQQQLPPVTAYTTYAVEAPHTQVVSMSTTPHHHVVAPPMVLSHPQHHHPTATPVHHVAPVAQQATLPPGYHPEYYNIAPAPTNTTQAQPVYSHVPVAAAPPTMIAYNHVAPQQQQQQQQQQHIPTQPAMQLQQPQPPQQQHAEQHPHHARIGSFLPSDLNAVPELFPTADGTTEDFLMTLIDDGDWAIGEGVDMDMNQ